MDNKPLLSFSFSKKKEPTQVVAPTKVLCKDEDSVRMVDVDFVASIDDKQIVSTKPAVEKKELVIPLIQDNNWRMSQAKKRQEAKSKKEIKQETDATDVKAETVELTLEQKACRELIQEARNFNDESDDRNINSNRVIPIFVANRVPDGFEDDNDFDVSARAENPSQDDYERVPVEEFGMAMLRGMGFKPEDATKVPVVDVKIRPKGLGLGAEIPAPTKQAGKVKLSSSSKKEEELELKNNAQVYVMSGKHKGFYGVVEGLDDDMLQADVRLLIPNMTVSVPVVFLRVVSRDEFKKESKVLNKSSYEEYKSRKERSRHDEGQQRDGRRGDDVRSEGKYRSSDRRRGKESDDREKREKSKKWENDGDDGDYDKKGVKEEEKRATDENGHHRRPHRHHDQQQHRSRQSDDRQEDGSKDGPKFNLQLVKEEVMRGGEIDHQTQDRRHHHHHGHHAANDLDAACSWLRSGLRVRIIDRDWSRGKHYNQKVEIIDIVKPGTCTVLTSDRIQLSDVMSHMIETIVPRDKGSKVMILNGIHKNEAGILIHRDLQRQEAQVQLLEDRNEIVTYHFDHICEFVGDADL